MQEQMNDSENKLNEETLENKEAAPVTEESQTPPKMNSYLLAGIIILLCIPLFYLFLSGPKAPENTAATTTPEQSNLASLEQAANTNPTLTNLINLGIAYQQNKKINQSITVFNKALESNPNNVVVLNNLGVSFIMNRQFDEADSVLNQALQVDSAFQLAKNNLAWSKLEKDLLLKAIAKKEAVPAEQRKPQDYIDLGLDYYALKQYEKSIELFNECLKLDPSNSLAYNNMGTSYMFMKRYDDAIRSFEKAIELDDEMQLYKNNLAWAKDEKTKASAAPAQ